MKCGRGRPVAKLWGCCAFPQINPFFFMRHISSHITPQVANGISSITFFSDSTFLTGIQASYVNYTSANKGSTGTQQTT